MTDATIGILLLMFAAGCIGYILALLFPGKPKEEPMTEASAKEDYCQHCGVTPDHKGICSMVKEIHYGYDDNGNSYIKSVVYKTAQDYWVPGQTLGGYQIPYPISPQNPFTGTTMPPWPQTTWGINPDVARSMGQNTIAKGSNS